MVVLAILALLAFGLELRLYPGQNCRQLKPQVYDPAAVVTSPAPVLAITLGLLAFGQELRQYPSQRRLQGKASGHHLKTPVEGIAVAAKPVLAILGLLAFGQEKMLTKKKFGHQVKSQGKGVIMYLSVSRMRKFGHLAKSQGKNRSIVKGMLAGVT